MSKPRQRRASARPIRPSPMIPTVVRQGPVGDGRPSGPPSPPGDRPPGGWRARPSARTRDRPRPRGWCRSPWRPRRDAGSPPPRRPCRSRPPCARHSQLGRRREHPLGIGLAARDRAEHPGQQPDQLVLGERPPGPVEDQLAAAATQALEHRRARLVQARHGIRRAACRASSAVDPGQAADVPADHQGLDAGAKRLEVRRLEMRVERRLVVIDLEQNHPVRLFPIDRDGELDDSPVRRPPNVANRPRRARGTPRAYPA